MKLKHLLPLIILFCTPAKAQRNDTAFYEVHTKNLCVTLLESRRNYSINIKSNPYQFLNDTIDIRYKGNTPFTTGICLDYDIFSLAVNFKSVSVDEDTKGLSEMFAVALGFGGTRYIVETYFSYLKGFYDANSTYYYKSFKSRGDYYSQPELTSQTLKGKFIYVFNDKEFAFKNGCSAIYRQKKSAGSLLVQGNISSSKFSNNRSLVPDGQFLDSLIPQVISLNSLSLAAGGGIAGTWVIGNHFFLNGTLFILAEFQKLKAVKETSQNMEAATNAAFDSRMCFGYNGRNFFASFSGRAETSIFRVNGFNMRNSALFFDLSIGYRFDLKDPSFMKQLRKNKLYQAFE